MHDLFDPADPSHSDAQRAGARGAQCSSDHLSTAVFGANTSAPTSDRVTHQATHWVARTALSVDHPEVIRDFALADGPGVCRGLWRCPVGTRRRTVRTEERRVGKECV